jgi:hypothetical protein
MARTGWWKLSPPRGGLCTRLPYDLVESEQW